MLPGVFIEVFLSGRSIWFFCIIGRGKGICRYSLVISNFYVRYEAVEWKLYFPYYSRYLLYSLYFTCIICERWFYASCTYGFCFYAILLVYYYFICIYVVAQIHNICMFFLSKLFNLLPDFGIFGFSGDSATVDWTGLDGMAFDFAGPVGAGTEDMCIIIIISIFGSLCNAALCFFWNVDN